MNIKAVLTGMLAGMAVHFISLSFGLKITIGGALLATAIVSSAVAGAKYTPNRRTNKI